MINAAFFFAAGCRNNYCCQHVFPIDHEPYHFVPRVQFIFTFDDNCLIDIFDKECQRENMNSGRRLKRNYSTVAVTM